MTIGRLVAWMMVWLSGWALFFIDPVGYSGLGTVLLLVAAPLLTVTPRDWSDEPVRKGAFGLILLVGLFLVVVFLLPPSFTWQFPNEPRLLTGVEILGAAVAVTGIAVTSRRFIRDHAGTA